MFNNENEMSQRFQKGEIPPYFLAPQTLYKYHNVNDYLFTLIGKSELWFSNPSAFNDPYDCNTITYDTESPSSLEIEEFILMYIKQMFPGIVIDKQIKSYAKNNSN